MRRHPAALQRKAARSLQPPPPPAQKVVFFGLLDVWACASWPLFFWPSSGGLETGGTLRDTEGMKEGTDLGISGMGGGCQWQH